MKIPIEERLAENYWRVVQLLKNEQRPEGWWVGELSTSALSTATAVMALSLARRHESSFGGITSQYDELIDGGLKWLADHQNSDGGWGDTVRNVSNISTTMLANAVFCAVDQSTRYDKVTQRSQDYIDAAGGVDAVIKRYGRDHTFSVPILTHCALAGNVDWRRVMPLPFELACIPARLYAAVRMPVVSYALPALIAIGHVIFHHRGHWNPLVRWIRRAAIGPSLRVLERIQPEHGGFLEATPLTSFVCMSLLGCGHVDHVVTRRCLDFICKSVRDDGSWPIDTNLTTWVTTLSVNATSLPRPADQAAENASLSADQRSQIRNWLLGQQYRVVHPYTNSPPGGWSWTDLPGGVPDADDTPGGILAVMNLRTEDEAFGMAEIDSLQSAATWLLNLQNRDGGWPTFCRGWGTLPFDRSSNDLTAHVIRALSEWLRRIDDISATTERRVVTALARARRFLQKHQAPDGSWLPLWFGNQHNVDDENPLYGTSRVVLALGEVGWLGDSFGQRGVLWLLQNQNEDGGWSARRGIESSVEETALAVESLATVPVTAFPEVENAVLGGVSWLCDRIEDGSVAEPSPIGFYFAKLWYFERLYPIIFTAASLRRCLQQQDRQV